jgi:outer membrane protein TolC
LIDMTRQAFFLLLGACATAGLSAGCAALKRTAPLPPPAALEAATNSAPAAASALLDTPPEGFAWDDLARLAAARSTEAAALLLDAEAERRQAAVDTGWRNPRLTAGHHWGDEDENTRTSSGGAEWGDRSFSGSTLGLRVYTANPFVNRWLRKRGAAAASAVEAEAQEAAYAVFCEVKSLCLEADFARADLDLLGQVRALREQACALRREQAEAGVAGALDLVKAEAGLAALSAELRERQLAHGQLILRIAALCGLPADRVRLRRGDAAPHVHDEHLSAESLTELAFLRRPDLARALREKDAAAYAVEASRAGQIPWFEFVEAQYETESADSDSFGGSSFDSSNQDEAEWQLRAAVTVPVFSWMGDELRLSRAKLAAAEARAGGLYDQIRCEIDSLLRAFLGARTEQSRADAERGRILSDLGSRIDALAGEPTVRREDVLAAREDLIQYSRTCMKAERECMRLALDLETASGGPLAAAP